MHTKSECPTCCTSVRPVECVCVQLCVYWVFTALSYTCNERPDWALTMMVHWESTEAGDTAYRVVCEVSVFRVGLSWLDHVSGHQYECTELVGQLRYWIYTSAFFCLSNNDYFPVIESTCWWTVWDHSTALVRVSACRKWEEVTTTDL